MADKETSPVEKKVKKVTTSVEKTAKKATTPVVKKVTKVTAPAEKAAKKVATPVVKNAAEAAAPVVKKAKEVTAPTVKMVKITQVKSAIGYSKVHKGTIRALGFHRLNQTVEHPDTATLRGMLRKVNNLIVIEE